MIESSRWTSNSRKSPTSDDSTSLRAVLGGLMRTCLACILLTMTACGFELPDPRNCDDRSAWYPDEDGDGVGEPTEVYIGCEAPEGWVDNVDTGAPYQGARRQSERGWRIIPEPMRP